ncbi:MAG: penicillin-binding protein 1A [Methylophilus sp.]|nr:penicillin-binding protein 1A [Methylophilus sp.]MDP3609789.1 penicillin-binding protein 1A [Methylophilus sp.]
MSPKKWWHFLILFFVVGALVLTALTALAVSIIYPSLPSLEALTNYRPKLSLKIYSAEGDLIGEFGEERRAFVHIENVPETMKEAVLAIEDRRFYQHNGIDTIGVARAIRNNVMGISHEGASTITMQVAKNFFSQPGGKRDMITKIKEALLAIKIEKTIEKDKILELYINQIYLGQRSYGFAAASQVYFGKQLKDLNLAESALLAGMPKAPSRYNPYTHEKRAMVRQNEVLRDMLRYGFIEQSEFDQAMNTKLKFKPTKTVKNLSADYVAEIVRISMFNRYGEDIYQSGFKVYTTIKKKNQEAANAAVVQGIVDYELRHGFRGPEKNITIPDGTDLKEFAVTALEDFDEYNRFTPALVTHVTNKSITVITKYGESLEISEAGLKLIEKHILSKKETKEAVKPGAVIRVTKLLGDWKVVQLPQVEASLIALNPETGAVNALIGGFDFNRSKFNHVTQAWRQPGSSFKPFVYSAAIEKGFTPATMVDDAPFSLSADEVGSKQGWDPHNFDGKYAGPIRLRSALTKSKNMVSIRVLESIGPRYAQSYITKFGFAPKHHPAYLAMALGAGSTTSWSLAAGYAVFANSGYQVKPYLITKIVDADGKVIESVDPSKHISAYRVIDQRNAFLMTSMMQDVINKGTARQASVLGRSDIAGKTGTTNNQMDVWFAGFNPKEVAVAWMGYDTPKSLGRNETGGRAALPIWIKYMEVALKNMPVYQYKVPQGVVKLKIDPEDGALLSDFSFQEGIDEYFYHENPPPSATYDIPSLESSTEGDYARPDSMDMITNPMRNNDVKKLPPVEERKLEPMTKPDTPRKDSNTESKGAGESATSIINSDF